MRISIIIPTLNEASHIKQTLTQVVAQRQQQDEVIVVDGGSTDQTTSLAKQWASVITAPRGRAVQMNAGARHAKGDIFLFLHADTQLPSNGLALIREVIEQKGSTCGRFRMQFDEVDWLLRLYQSYTRFHCFSYGDQAFFVTRPLYNRLQGFREEVPFEDIDFYKRLRAIAKPCIIKTCVRTSARRFRAMGSLSQKLINILLVTMHYFGLNVFPIKKKLYPDIRSQ